MVVSELIFHITLLPIFVVGSSSLDGQVLIGLFFGKWWNSSLSCIFFNIADWSARKLQSFSPTYRERKNYGGKTCLIIWRLSDFYLLDVYQGCTSCGQLVCGWWGFFLQYLRNFFFVSTAEDWGLRSSLLNSFSFVFLAIIFVAGRVKLFCSKKPWFPALWRECHENKTYAFKDKTLRKFAYVWGQTTTCATLMQIYCNWCLQPGIYWYHLR